MPKQSLLPPADNSKKREVSVNLRFSAEVYERLKTVAAFSKTGVASLLFYVTVNTTLPMMEKEMQHTEQNAHVKPKPPDKPKPPESPTENIAQE